MGWLTACMSSPWRVGDAPFLWRVWLCVGVACAAFAGGTGCAEQTIRPNRALLQEESAGYSDHDWARVLDHCVRDGLVDYRTLKASSKSLKRYYAILSQTGPTLTPEFFETRSDRVAYWINAYNALVLLAVLERYPVATMYDLSLPRLEHEYHFSIDGRECTLAWIEAQMMADSGSDARVLLATSRAAMGTPCLADRPYRGGGLDGQLAKAAARSLNNPHLCRLDHDRQSILVWQMFLNREADFLAYWESRHRTETGYLFNVLLDLASPERRRQLQGVVGYQVLEIPFDRRLNEYRPGPRRPSAP
jgi:hypothetical protein